MRLRKKLLVTTLASVCLISGSITAFASYGTEHVKIGSISGGAQDIRVWNDSSVASYGYTDTVDNSIADWNAASSKIGLYYSSTSPELKVYVVTDLPANTFGATDYWNYNGSQVTPSNITNGTSSFDLGRVRLDANQLANWNWQEPT